jgi:hypothetical protein
MIKSEPLFILLTAEKSSGWSGIRHQFQLLDISLRKNRRKRLDYNFNSLSLDLGGFEPNQAEKSCSTIDVSNLVRFQRYLIKQSDRIQAAQ